MERPILWLEWRRTSFWLNGSPAVRRYPIVLAREWQQMVLRSPISQRIGAVQQMVQRPLENITQWASVHLDWSNFISPIRPTSNQLPPFDMDYFGHKSCGCDQIPSDYHSRPPPSMRGVIRSRPSPRTHPPYASRSFDFLFQKGKEKEKT